MKLFILKLLSLVVFCLGIISLLVALGLPEVKAYLEQVPALIANLQSKLPPELDFLKEVLTVQGLWFTGSIVAIVFGIYGFAPRSTKIRKPKKITYTGPHGEVQIQLDTVEQSLNHVLMRMPEIKRINVKVDPQDGGRRALIRAEVVLYQRPGQNARALASLVTDYIAETASKLLGIEDLATIELKVTGIVVNSKKSSKAIRKESLSHTSPVELLESPRTPLTLSGPREPIGSGPIENELEDDVDEALETSAVDTHHEVTNQAAARSELLEPFNVGKTPSTEPASFHTGDHEPVGEPQEAVEATAPPEAPTYTGFSSVNTVAPLEMDVLDEPLTHDGEVHYADVEADDVEDMTYRSEVSSVGAEDLGEGTLDDDPAYGGTLATEEEALEEEEKDPEEHTPFQDVRVDELAAEGEGHHPIVDGEEHIGDVTIPEGEDDPNATGEEKKRWGWFN